MSPTLEPSPPASAPLVFDLRYATAHYPGVGSYAVGLARALLERFPEWPWRFLTPRDAARFDLSFVPAALREPAGNPSPGASQLALGRRLNRMGAALYHSPFMLRPWRARCASILTVHDVIPLEYPEGMSGFRREVYRRLVGDSLEAERVITDSQSSRDAILAFFPQARPPEVVHPGVRARGGGEPWPAWERDAVLTVGINKPHKNVKTLIRALALVPAEHRPLLVIAGPNDRRFADPAKLAAQFGVTESVRVPGMVPEERLDALYRSAALFAFPTRVEGFGLPLLEALSLGVPALASDIPVLREVAGDAARFCAAEDAGAWAQAMLELLREPASRAELARRGRERSRAFDFALASERIGGHYRALVPALAEEARAWR